MATLQHEVCSNGRRQHDKRHTIIRNGWRIADHDVTAHGAVAHYAEICNDGV